MKLGLHQNAKTQKSYLAKWSFGYAHSVITRTPDNILLIAWHAVLSRKT